MTGSLTTELGSIAEPSKPPRFPRVGHVHVYDTTVSVWEEQVREDMFAAFSKVCTHLYNRRFVVRACEETRKHYRCLSRTTRVGRKGNLEFSLRLSGRHLEMQFFQNIHVDNPNGGRYDSSKFGKMPRRMQLEFLVEARLLVEMLLGLGYSLGDKSFSCWEGLPLALTLRNIAEGRKDPEPLRRFNQDWDSEYDLKRGTHRFKRDETGWPAFEEYGKSYGNVDRDKKTIRNGETKYYRSYNGYLCRATVYTNLCTMWRCYSGVGYTCVSSSELFDCPRPDLEKRRFRKGQVDRLVKKELALALEQKDWKRVATLARVIERLTEKAP